MAAWSLARFLSELAIVVRSCAAPLAAVLALFWALGYPVPVSLPSARAVHATTQRCPCDARRSSLVASSAEAPSQRGLQSSTHGGSLQTVQGPLTPSAASH